MKLRCFFFFHITVITVVSDNIVCNRTIIPQLKNLKAMMVKKIFSYQNLEVKFFTRGRKYLIALNRESVGVFKHK